MAVEAGDSLPGLDDFPPAPRADAKGKVTSALHAPERTEESSVDEFCRKVSATGLVELSDLDSVVQERQPLTGSELADELVRQDRLTHYQAEQLCRPIPEPLILGDYVLLEQIGKGGMGEVFRAVHRRVHREVALKVLPPQMMNSSNAVERFERETEAAAQLEHDHIVRVYEVGSDQNRHYFAMQLVPGKSLAEHLQHGPLECRQAATYLESISRAVAFAHERGILHRDIKPHNVLIDDRDDRAVIADFGLAKLTEAGAELTQSGAVMGTPQYMSPEQAQDAADVTTVSDVYSIGATLYHAVTGRPPFQAATPVDTLRQVIEMIAVAPRHLNPQVDRDLETICEKCLEKLPHARYPSASHLAEELGRYLRGEPVVARPISAFGRLRRWCARNRAIAVASGLALMFLVCALVATSIGYFETSIARDEAEQGFFEARGAVYDFLTLVTDEELLDQPGLQPLKMELLDKALQYYQRFLEQRGGDNSIQEEIADVHYRVGLISEQILTADDALASYRNARAIRQQLAAHSDDVNHHREELGRIWNAEGRVLAAETRQEPAIRAFNTSLSIRRDLAQQTPDNTNLRRELANTQMNLGVLIRSGDVNQALEYLTAAQELRIRILQDDPLNIKVLRDAGRGHFNLANTYDALNDSESLIASLRLARDAFESVLKLQPEGLSDQYRLALCCRTLADRELDVNLAVELYDQAYKLIRRLALRNPEVENYRSELAAVMMRRSELESQAELHDSSLQTLQRLKELLLELKEENVVAPEEVEYDLAVATHALSMAALKANRTEMALTEAMDATARLQNLLKTHPHDPTLKELLADLQELSSSEQGN